MLEVTILCKCTAICVLVGDEETDSEIEKKRFIELLIRIYLK